MLSLKLWLWWKARFLEQRIMCKTLSSTIKRVSLMLVYIENQWKKLCGVMQKCVLCKWPLTQHGKQHRSRMERQTLRGWVWRGWGRQVEAYRLHGLEWSCVNVDATVKGFGDRLKHLGLRGRGGGLLRRQGHGDLGCISYITHISKPLCTHSICETTAVYAVTCRGSMVSVCGRGSELWGGW